ncbi:MAG: flagellar biosynthetic protein FliQ [Oleispira sp.]|nr:flagellar biosynthetic protein FliQ [Oleispira sp.]MBL4881730.1 flagellar biosynthetic protein FliQ [Oleispira sp.]MBL4881927.1 flagellar biosynthetic protein FliQ [Oleispira sp.]
MGVEQIGDLFSQALFMIVTIVFVMVIPSLVVGLCVATFQAATQINEQTLSFLPRLIITLLSLIFFGPWAVNKVVEFTLGIYTNIPFLVG